MAVAALLLWLCTAAVGGYLLMTAAHASGTTEVEADAEPAEAVPAASPSGAGVPPAKPARARDRFDPPSLQRAKSQPIPGWGALAEFAHPALAMVGLSIWLGYVVSRKQLFAEIGLGLLLGAVVAGLSWATVNARAARRMAAQGADLATAPPGTAPLAVSHRVLALHAGGAALTLVLAILIAVHA